MILHLNNRNRKYVYQLAPTTMDFSFIRRTHHHQFHPNNLNYRIKELNKRWEPSKWTHYLYYYFLLHRKTRLLFFFVFFVWVRWWWDEVGEKYDKPLTVFPSFRLNYNFHLNNCHSWQMIMNGVLHNTIVIII